MAKKVVTDVKPGDRVTWKHLALKTELKGHVLNVDRTAWGPRATVLLSPVATNKPYFDRYKEHVTRVLWKKIETVER